ncbi:hypothetical protein C368_02767 [Cryptococcus neoformans 125.91]|nr:hypothetical protein C368_02767 [Cryptococcus neoformans var. grubii 125.91]
MSVRLWESRDKL